MIEQKTVQAPERIHIGADHRMVWARSAGAYLFGGAKSLDFGRSLFRIWLSYPLDWMRYGLFTAIKPNV